MSICRRSDRIKSRSKSFSLQIPTCIPLPASSPTSCKKTTFFRVKQLTFFPIFLQQHCHIHCKKVNSFYFFIRPDHQTAIHDQPNSTDYIYMYMKKFAIHVWFQKISTPQPQREITGNSGVMFKRLDGQLGFQMPFDSIQIKYRSNCSKILST